MHEPAYLRPINDGAALLPWLISVFVMPLQKKAKNRPVGYSVQLNSPAYVPPSANVNHDIHARICAISTLWMI
jgi:hypothetical protein